MTTLYSLLRCSGFRVSQLVQLRIINQDYLIIRSDEQGLYLISHDRLTVCSKRTIYPSGSINKVFGAEWFIDFKQNHAEIDPTILSEYNEIAKNTFLPIYHTTGNESERRLSEQNDSVHNLRHEIFNLASSVNNSIFQWAKYAHQSLLVSKPEAYIYWSIQSNWGNISFNEEEEIYDYLKHFKRKSIFPENDRIMTADQCIRNQTGNDKDIAVFLYAALRKFLHLQGCVIFTKKSEYCVYRRKTDHDLVIYHLGHRMKRDSIEGDIILIFNESNSFYPLNHGENGNKDWYNDMITNIIN